MTRLERREYQKVTIIADITRTRYNPVGWLTLTIDEDDSNDVVVESVCLAGEMVVLVNHYIAGSKIF